MRPNVVSVAPLILIVIALESWASSPTSTPIHEAPTRTAVPPAATAGTIVVSSDLDRGPGSLRDALRDAREGDIITFDPAVFPPAAPAAISLARALPEITQDHLTIDASDAGVILDGSNVEDATASGLSISSSETTIRGLQIVDFPASGILLHGGAQRNVIGGDRSVGAGPLGQGNVLSGNGGIGVFLLNTGTSFNTVAGNYIGTDASGTQPRGNHAPGIHMNRASENQVLNNLISGNDGYGIDLGTKASSNRISGNIIGADASGERALSNLNDGVFLHVGASGNTIGPGNVIAFNIGSGVGISRPGSVGNTVTQNSIHDNAAMAIYLSAGGNARPTPPVVLDLDLQAGTVAGETCAGCTVEVFSDEEAQAARYEGTTTADGSGAFALETGGPLAGPHVTAVSIDGDGNSSPVSTPPSGPVRTEILQPLNDRPRARIVPKGHAELIDTRIGDMFQLISPFLGRNCPHPEKHPIFAHVLDLGFTWARVSLDPREWWSGDVGSPRYDGPFSDFDVTPCQDAIISALAEHGVTIVLTIVFWDERFHADRPPDYGNEEEVRGYLEYTRFIVRHFEDRVRYFEILNEAALFVDLPDYLALIRRAVRVIDRESPRARVVVGGAAGLEHEQNRDYLFGVLRSDVMGSVDAIETHPMYEASPEFDDEYYYGYPSLVREIKRVAREHGFAGQYLSEEMNWRTPLNAGDRPLVYTPIAASKYFLRAIVLHRGLGVWAGMDMTTDNLSLGNGSTVPSFVEAAPRLATILDGAKPRPLAVDIQSDAANLASYSFSLPNGDRLLALWADGTAVDHDPGVPATLAFPDLAVERVVGMDVFIGFQQDLITEQAGTSLIVRDLLVKDYPIFLRLVG